jgi:hypothetical protein
MDFYNLDMIISVGYRVNSKRGTQFRIWANKVLKDFLIKGYAINETRIRSQTWKIKELENTVALMSGLIDRKQLSADEATGLSGRIAAFLFLWFLDENGVLYKKDGSRRLSDNALVALTLMIAESRSSEKETVVKVIVNLINKRN